MKFMFSILVLGIAGIASARPSGAPSGYVCGEIGSGEIVCNAPNEPEALSKFADLPAITKVYSGTSRALIVRVQFPDSAFSTTKVTDSLIDRNNATINGLYLSMSRNTFQFAFSLHPDIWTTPDTAGAYDGSSFSALQTFISGKITEAGYVKGAAGANGYEVFVAVFPRLNVGWSGLSTGSRSGGNYINGGYGTGVTAHELGHAVGLPHAHSIEAETGIFGTPGTDSQHVEYGHPFDVMGHGGSAGHFNANHKWRVGWMDTNEVREIRNSGIYRLYAQDNAVHSGRLLSVRIPIPGTSYAYWIEYRTTNTNARNGAVLMFEGFLSSARGIHFLDMTPGSRTSDDERDGILAVGQTLTDPYANISIRNVAINTGVWDQNGWVELDVVIPGANPIVFKPLKGHKGDLSILDGRYSDVLGRRLNPENSASILRFPQRKLRR
jgi:hypothetical protein